MRLKLFELLLPTLVEQLLTLLPVDQLKVWIDQGLDLLEDSVEKSDTKLDDYTILPALRRLRETFNIPDND